MITTTHIEINLTLDELVRLVAKTNDSVCPTSIGKTTPLYSIDNNLVGIKFTYSNSDNSDI